LSAIGQDLSESLDQALVTDTNLPACIPVGVFIFMGSNGNAYMAIEDKNNACALPIGGKAANRVLQGYALQSGARLKAYEVKEINDELTTHAEHCGDVREVYFRCAPFQNGVELDIGNGSRIRITPGNVATIDKGSKTLFHRTPTMRALTFAFLPSIVVTCVRYKATPVDSRPTTREHGA
jgi:hypothetical protein